MHSATLTLCLSAAAGVMLVIAAQRLKVPSIVLLLTGGILLGPQVLGVIDPGSLGRGLETVVSLAIAVILFEGGLTLDLEGYRKSPTVIRRLLTIGPILTWLGIGTAVHFLFSITPAMSLMTASLVIVTGPTVISPLLRRIRVKERVHHVLYWEGVLIDAVGVFVAVLCYEWLTPENSNEMFAPVARFGLRILVGMLLGLSMGLSLAFVLRKEWVPREHVNILVLAVALLTFGLAHFLISESGILAVVVAGLAAALKHPPQLKYVKRFKLQLTELGIGTIFILLAAKLEPDRFSSWKLLVLLAVVMLVVRPLVVWTSTAGQGFTLKEKTFLSWIAPRGIVAAAMASLFSLRLRQLGYDEAVYLETVTYAVVIATVTLQGLSAPWLAKVLNLQRSDRKTWVLMGNHVLVAALSRGLKRAGVKTVELSGLFEGDDSVDPEDPRFSDAHAVLCADITMLSNVWSAHKWGLSIRAEKYYRWATFEPDEDSDLKTELEMMNCSAVWRTTVSAAIVSGGLDTGSHAIEVIELGKNRDLGRFGPGLLPLFWVHKGKASIVPDPTAPGEPEGEMAVVLKRRIMGLSNLLSHVEVIISDGRETTFGSVLARLIDSAAQQYPSLPTEELTRSILSREESMPATIGAGIAIPHAYSEGVETSSCFLGAVPDGISNMDTPDGLPVRLVFLLISPQGKASVHLESLAALASLGQEPEFVDFICRQRVPARIASLIRERG